MKNVCPVCEKSSGIEVVTRKQVFKIKGEIINVDVDLYTCKNCDTVFSSKELGDPFKKAYRTYREVKKMVQPEEIVAFRQKYELTQKELSSLLGFGDVTLSRYENGSLQDEAHDTLLKLVMDPTNLLDLINAKEDLFLDKKKKDLQSRLIEELAVAKICFDILSSDRPNKLNGFRILDLTKVAEAIKVFCFNRDVYKTKLFKLLFYSDFLNFKVYDFSITGLKYAHLPLGPVPDEYNFILGALLNFDKEIEMELVEFPQYSGEIIKVKSPPDKSVFSDTEFEILNFVNEKFKELSTNQLIDLTHNEQAYICTNNSEIIPYDYAKKLNLDLEVF